MKCFKLDKLDKKKFKNLYEGSMKMNIVEPIRDTEKIEEIHNYLTKKNKRDALLFSFGIYSGLRISDILKFRVADCYKKTYNIREKKTNKQKIMEWNPHLYKEIQEFIKNRKPNDFLFKSRNGYNQPISRVRAYQIIVSACNNCQVYNIGTHSLRKTFGYHMYKKSKDIAMLMDLLNHSAPDITLRYIGISNEKSNENIKKMKLF